MGVRLTSEEHVVALYDSVTGWAFGPVFDSEPEAKSFLEFTKYGPDMRPLTDTELEDLYFQWLRTQPEEV